MKEKGRTSYPFVVLLEELVCKKEVLVGNRVILEYDSDLKDIKRRYYIVNTI
jgi:hypothetical protein